MSLFMLFLAPVVMLAATTSSVQLLITDQKGAGVPGATIEVSTFGTKLATATTDEHGNATLNIPAGKVDFTVSKEGFVTTQTSLDLAPSSSPTQLEIVLPQSSLSKQEINVTAAPSEPSAESSNTPATIAPEQAKVAPTKPATLIDALPLVPGVTRTPDGSVQIAGADETHSALLVNSVNVTDPATGEFGLSVPIDTVQTISVSEMPYLAQYGKFTAGVVAAETRRGGDKWEYSLNDPLPDFRIRSGHLQGVRDMSPRLNFSGPIIPNKLYFVEGGEFLLYKREVRTLSFPYNETKSEAINSFTQMDWIVSPNQTLTASFHIAPQSLKYAGLNFFNQQPVTPDANFHETTPTLLDRWQIGGGLLQSTFAVTRVGSSIYPQGTEDMVLTPGGNYGNYYNQQNRKAIRYQWLENWAPRTLHFHGDHQFQIGSVFAHSENEGSFQPHQVLIRDASGNLLQSINFSGQGSFDISDTAPAFYVQDHWTVNSRLGFDIGTRVESQTITGTWRTAPRAGFVFSPPHTGDTVIRGGMGVFYDSVPLDVYAFSSYPQQVVTTYDPVTGAIIDGPRDYLNIIGQAPTNGFDFIHRASRTGNFAPYSVAGNIEVEHSFGHFVLMRVKYLQSAAQDLITINPQSFGSQSALVLGSSGQSHTRQLEFTARIGSKENRQFFFSYVRQHARGDVTDANGYLGNFPFPIARQNLLASLPGEIPNRFLLWGTYRIGKSWLLIPKVELRNGFPYYPTDVYQQYVDGLALQSRFPRYFSADLRVSKDIKISSKHAVRLSATVLNLTNHFNPLEVHSNIADPMYGYFFGNYNRKFTIDFDFLY